MDVFQPAAVQVCLALAQIDSLRVFIEVRLADLGRAVAGLLEHLKERFLGFGQFPFVLPHAVVMRISAAPKRRARRHAEGRCRDGLGEPRALPGNAIDVRCSELGMSGTAHAIGALLISP